MARAEEAVRRGHSSSNNNIGNNSLTNSYIDNFLDVSELPTSSVLYELTLSQQIINDDDFSSTAIVAVPSNFKPLKAKVEKGSSSSSERIYFCSECGASFSNASNFRSHFRTHTGEKPYSCEFCSASFIQSSNLKAHRRIHTGEKPYKCDVCNKAFTRSSHLVGHKRTHTADTPFSCSICRKSFSQSSQLKLHIMKHKLSDTLNCGYCDKSFISESSLFVHSQLHKGERPYICCDCSAAFRCRDDLNSHKRLHTGEIYPYSCHKCGKGFKIQLCCVRHIVKCTVEEKNCDSNNDKKRTGNPQKFRRIENKKKKKDQVKQSLPVVRETFHFPENLGDEMCSMEMLERSIEEGVEDEIFEHTVVFSTDE